MVSSDGSHRRRWRFFLIFDINDRGQIVGYFFDARGVGHGFLAECDAKQSSRRPMENAMLAGRTCNGAEEHRVIDGGGSAQSDPSCGP
jgi:hypothetical protein